LQVIVVDAPVWIGQASDATVRVYTSVSAGVLAVQVQLTIAELTTVPPFTSKGDPVTVAEQTDAGPLVLTSDASMSQSAGLVLVILIGADFVPGVTLTSVDGAVRALIVPAGTCEKPWQVDSPPGGTNPVPVLNNPVTAM
jgi:hypothetical protein